MPLFDHQKPHQQQRKSFLNHALHKSLAGSFFWMIGLPVIADVSTQPQELEEVVVSVSKRDQGIKNFSGSISVVPGSSLTQNATLSNIASQVPGLSLLDNGPRNTTSLIIRGLRLDAVGSYDFGGDGSTVASYVDNIPLQGYFVPPAFSLKDLQQVEIIRGPQGTLYGNASIGGLIRYITAKPDLTRNAMNLNAAISQTAHSDGLNYDTDLTLNAPLITDTLGLRILLGTQKNQGFIDNPYLISGAAKDINSDDTNQIRTSLLWKPTEDLSINSSYHYQNIHADDRQSSNESFTKNEYTASSQYRQPMTGTLALSSVDANYQMDFANLNASISRYDYTTKTRSDLTDFLHTVYGEGYYADYEDFSAYEDGYVSVKKNSAELRLVSPDNQSLRWLLGAFFSKDNANLQLADFVPGFSDFDGQVRPHDLDLYATQTAYLQEQSFYSELAYDIKPNWEVLVGARNFRYKDNFKSCYLYFPTNTYFEGDNYPLNCTDGDDLSTGNLGKFSTKYNITADHTIYFTLSEGFRRGGANALPVEITHNREYEADASVNYEIGTHSDFFEQRLQMSAALFYMSWKKIQVASVLVENGKGYNVIANAGSARSQGAELEAKALLTKEWAFHGSYTMSDAQLTESVMGINGGIENAYSGDTLPGSPRNQWNVGIDYNHVFTQATFIASFNFSYLSDINTTLNKEFSDYAKLNSYTNANANMGVILRNWKVALFVNNMNNTRSIVGKRTAVLYGERGQFETINRPRTLGLLVNYQF